MVGKILEKVIVESGVENSGSNGLMDAWQHGDELIDDEKDIQSYSHGWDKKKSVKEKD